jgi:hypothetical protein
MKDKIEFETFMPVGSYTQRNLKQEEPSCFNGMVRVVKYRVTVEMVEESKEIIWLRLKKLWDECSNMHHRNPLREAAKKIGMKL